MVYQSIVSMTNRADSVTAMSYRCFDFQQIYTRSMLINHYCFHPIINAHVDCYALYRVDLRGDRNYVMFIWISWTSFIWVIHAGNSGPVKCDRECPSRIWSWLDLLMAWHLTIVCHQWGHCWMKCYSLFNSNCISHLFESIWYIRSHDLENDQRDVARSRSTLHPNLLNTLRPMAAIFQTTFWNGFSWMKMFNFRLRFHWSLFPRVKLTIFQHWFR